MNDFEFGIIGGGPAGAVTAIYLSRLGYSVCLFEKKSFPRDTLCGEFLSVEVINILQELDLLEQFLSLKPNTITRFRFINNDSKEITVPLNFKGFGLSRSVFDHFLLSQGKASGAVIFQPAEITEITNKGGSFILTVNNKKIAIDEKITVSKLIAAWGKQSKLDKILIRNFTNIKSGMIGVKIHFDKKHVSSFDSNEIRIYAFDKIYCGVNFINEGLVNLCYLEKRVNPSVPPKIQFVRMMKLSNNFRFLFQNDLEKELQEKSIIGTGNIFFGRRNLIERGIYTIGDAARVIAPLTGDGIGMAMESARLLASLFQHQKKMKLSENATQRMYIEKWNELFNERIHIASAVQKIIMNPLLRKTGVFLSNIYPAIIKRIIQRTRNANLIQY